VGVLGVLESPPRDLGKPYSMIPSKTYEILAALDQEVSTERLAEI
jgi:hypothetical protein